MGERWKEQGEDRTAGREVTDAMGKVREELMGIGRTLEFIPRVQSGVVTSSDSQFRETSLNKDRHKQSGVETRYWLEDNDNHLKEGWLCLGPGQWEPCGLPP